MTLTHLAASALLKSFYISQQDWNLLDGTFDSKTADGVLVALERAKRIRQLFVTTMGVPDMQLS